MTNLSAAETPGLGAQMMEEQAWGCPAPRESESARDLLIPGAKWARRTLSLSAAPPRPGRDLQSFLLKTPRGAGLSPVSRAYLTGGPLPHRPRAQTSKAEVAGKEAARRSCPEEPYHGWGPHRVTGPGGPGNSRRKSPSSVSTATQGVSHLPRGPPRAGERCFLGPGGGHGGAAEEGPPPLKPSPSASTTKPGEGARQAGVGGGETGTTEAGKAVETSEE